MLFRNLSTGNVVSAVSKDVIELMERSPYYEKVVPKAPVAPIAAPPGVEPTDGGADNTGNDDTLAPPEGDEGELEYSEDMKLTELKEVAAGYGVDASAMRTKKEVIEAIEAAKQE